jgi:methionyl-tRNA formyltransferase
MNVVLAAEESAGLQVLRALARSSHRLVAVLTSPPAPDSTSASVWNVARHLGFETWPAKLVKDPSLGKRLRAERVDVLVNVHSLHIISNPVLEAPISGAFNLHPGPLPRYAGLNPVSWAIFRGEQTHGVTVHKMEAGIDAGPVVYQSCFPIDPEDTALSVSFKCVREGVALVLRLLDVAAAEPTSLPLLPQNLAMREYFGKEVPERGWLSWSWTADRVVNFVRACDYFPFRSPWGHPLTRLGVQEFALAKARRTGLPCDSSPGTVGKSTGSGVHVACQDEWILASKLHLAGKYVPAQEILKPGDRLANL